MAHKKTTVPRIAACVGGLALPSAEVGRRLRASAERGPTSAEAAQAATSASSGAARSAGPLGTLDELGRINQRVVGVGFVAAVTRDRRSSAGTVTRSPSWRRD